MLHKLILVMVAQFKISAKLGQPIKKKKQKKEKKKK
jgi:hypothetical protein